MFDIMAAAVKSTLEAHPDFTLPVYIRRAPEDTDPPYVLITYILGGDENTAQTRYGDMWVKAAATVATPGEATVQKQIIDAALVEVLPVVTAINAAHPYQIATPYTTIEQMQEVYGEFTIQNRAYIQAGGIFRVRLQLTKKD